MSATVSKPSNTRGLAIAIAISTALLFIAIGGILSIWFRTPWPVIAAGVLGVVGVILALTVYPVLNQRRPPAGMPTLARRYAITLDDRNLDAEHRTKQINGIIKDTIFVLLVLLLLGYVGWRGIQALNARGQPAFGDIALIVGVAVTVFLLGALAVVFRRVTAEPAGLSWRGTAIVLSVFTIAVGAWFFYSGRFPARVLMLERLRSVADLGPVIALGVVLLGAVFGITVVSPERRFPTARNFLILGVFAFTLLGLFEFLGIGALLIIGVATAVVFIGLALHALRGLLHPLLEILKQTFLAIIGSLAAAVGFLAQLPARIWELLTSTNLWQSIELWVKWRGREVYTWAEYINNWLFVLTRLANREYNREQAGTEWTAAASDRRTALVRLQDKYLEEKIKLNGVAPG